MWDGDFAGSRELYPNWVQVVRPPVLGNTANNSSHKEWNMAPSHMRHGGQGTREWVASNK